MKNKSMNWQDKLIDLVEKEVYLSTGVKSKTHFSGNCKMNDILQQNTGYRVGQEFLGAIKQFISEVAEEEYERGRHDNIIDISTWKNLGIKKKYFEFIFRDQDPILLDKLIKGL
jgi:hypothetical protein